MKRLIPFMAAALLLFAIAPVAQAKDFGFEQLDVTIADEAGAPSMQAGSHPFAVTTTIVPNTEIDPELGKIPSGQPKELRVILPPGFIGSPDATPQCTAAAFSTRIFAAGGAAELPACPDSSALGLAEIRGAASANSSEAEVATPVYNLVPPPGVAARLGFRVVLTGAVVVDVTLKESPPYNAVATTSNITQMQLFYGADVTLWSDPSSSAHDDDRGLCGATLTVGEDEGGDVGDFLGITCPASIPPRPFITLPRSCEGPLHFLFEAESWQEPGEWVRGEVESHDDAVPPGPLGTGGCDQLGFAPSIAARPTSRSASAPTGLDFGLELRDEGLTNVDGIAASDLKKAVVTLPEGMTVNPSQAEGLAVCSRADFARERSDSDFGAGCPAASKIGSVEVETPLLEGVLLKGSVFVAAPRENPFGTLIALYMTIREPQRGIYVGLAGRVEPDPRSGRLITTFEDLPQTPFSRFRFHFREGGRSPLITPPLCGTYETEGTFTPWADPARPLRTTAGFEIDHGVGGGPCPAGGTPPFAPGFEAGTLNNDAGSHSPFYMRLTRRDGDQDLTRFSATLPPGVLGKIAGIPHCPEAAIAAAKAKTGSEELASPGCPAASRIGRTVAGAGVGSQLTYVPGSLYLAGPYNGDPLSVVAITPAVAGPFDVGTVVVREALDLNPESAEVEVDGAASDPIPHILAGIPLAVRDLRVHVDRPQFTLNATSCDPSQTRARLWGGGADPFSTADDLPLELAARYQAAGCAGLGFKPKLAIGLRGGTSRGDFPRLHATYTPRPGDANLKRLALRFPRSEFIEQGHFRTICTRVQFAAAGGNGAGCPPGSAYGNVRVWSPLLDEPLSGPVYLRSSDHNLPDAVFALHGLVDIEVVVRIDSVGGRLRATVQGAPDAPVSKAIVDMQGGRKGLFVNSTSLCRGRHRAEARLSGQNGKLARLNPAVGAGCKG